MSITVEQHRPEPPNPEGFGLVSKPEMNEQSSSFAEKRSLLKILHSKELTPEQLQLVREKFGLPIESWEAEIIPNADIEGLKVKLAETNEITSKELVEKLFLQLKHPDKWRDKLFKRFAFIAVENLKVPHLAKYVPKSYLKTYEQEQIFHHDGQSDSEDFIFGLYHGEVVDGTRERQANTMLSSAKKYSSEMVKFLLDWHIKNSGTELDGDQKQLYGDLSYILQHKEKHPDLEGPRWNAAGEKLFADNLREWGIDPNSTEARILYATEAHERMRGGQNSDNATDLAVEFRKQFEPNIYRFKWHKNTLLMLNNRTLVHGRAPKPADFDSFDPQTQETGLVKTNIYDLYNEDSHEIPGRTN